MSRENLEIVRAAADAWNRGDWDEMLSYFAPDAELDNSSVAGDYRGVHRGIDQVMRMLRQFMEPWESMQIEINELIDAGQHVVARTTGHFVGRDGIEVQARTAWCWTLRDGAVIRLLATNEWEDALAAAGLSR